jgi:hypothetical protein
VGLLNLYIQSVDHGGVVPQFWDAQIPQLISGEADIMSTVSI